jgi:ligand-binding sensor domain-containing protein
VYDILQDEQGFMWFGTRDGLYKYDGYSLIAYKNDPDDPTSLSDNRVRAVHQDRSGIFWIGTIGGGLNRFEPETEQFIRYRHDENDPHSLGSDDARVIFEDQAGNLWIGTEGGGLNRFVPETDDGQVAHFIRYQYDENNPHSLGGHKVSVIFEDRSGELWIGTKDGGLNHFDRETDDGQTTARFVRYQHDENDPHSLGDNEVLTIFEDRSGTLWIGTRKGGLSRFDPASGRGAFTNYRHDPDDPRSLGSDRNGVWTIYEDRTGVLWIGTLTGGINRFDRETEDGQAGRFTRYEATDGESIYTILEDQTGELWLGGLKQGVYRYDRTGDRFLNYQPDDSDPYSLGYNLVWTI